jgi:putative ABC transport system substrate-binding protein
MPDDGALMKAFLDGLRELGYIEDQNILIERRTAEGRFEKLGALAEQLVQAKVDIIIAPTTPAARAARRATASIPIVFTIVSDPIGSGLVTSFSHPGGNVTGVTDMDVDLAEKRLDMLKQLLPHLKRVGALGDPSDKVWEPEWKQAQDAAQKLHLDIVSVLVTSPEELEGAFVGLNRRVDALLVAPQAFFAVHRRSIIKLESRAKLPAIHERRVFTDAGALISYGPDYAALLRKTARYVDKILKGAKPADLPVEQPTEYELVINLKTAKALALTIPQSVLARADGVIR